jgi:hypothetical protein
MLHEILLSLSGHPSPLFETKGDNIVVNESFPLLSPPEKALLSSIGQLSKIHRDLKTHIGRISSSHTSTICRAVASSIQTVHLARFQQKILDVEERILNKDSSIVGAYQIVPLASVVGEFADYHRLLEWLWQIALFIHPISPKEPGNTFFAGPGLIDKLRHESQTGYPDIENAALELGKVAEAAWLRQLATWVLYGRLPAHGAHDFFVYQTRQGDSVFPEFEINNAFLPKFVTTETAASILFIGKSLNHIRNRGVIQETYGARKPMSELELLPIHLRFLSELVVPLSTAGLFQAISAIRLSLSRNTLQQLLPLSKVIQILELLREFFLLGRGEFAISLVTEADDRLQSRARQLSSHASSKVGDSVRGVLLKENEVHSILSKTWSVMSSLQRNEEATDENLELARDLISLTIYKPVHNRTTMPDRSKASHQHSLLTETSFNDILVSVPVTLNLDIPSPFDLFITSTELQVYSSLHSYLLAIRRAHLHLANLWRQSSLRREYPPPPGPSFSSSKAGQRILQHRRNRNNGRNSQMRKVWATCTAAIFLLSEMDEYFEGQVVNEAWTHFHNWIATPAKSQRPSSADSSMQPDIDQLTDSLRSSTLSSVSSAQNSEPIPRDPEVLATAQRRFLETVTQALLLRDAPFTHLLRTMLVHIDELVGYILRLQSIQQNLDLEEDEGVVDALANNEQEQKDVQLELDRSRKRVDGDMKVVVGRLRELDAAKVDTAFEGDEFVGADEKQEYVPWRGPGVERLLMKLDFGRASDEDMEEE